MLDPFLAPPALLTTLSRPIGAYLSLATLPLHIHEILLAFLFYHLVNTYFSPYISTKLFPAYYPSLNARTKANWDVHIVSLVQSCLINVLAIWVMVADEERKGMDWEGRVWGYTGADGMIQGFAAGYFLWDLCVCAAHVDVFGWGLLAHAVAALIVFSLGFVRILVLLLVVCATGDVTAMVKTDELAGVLETLCQLLCPHFHPLRAVLAVPELSLVLR